MKSVWADELEARRAQLLHSQASRVNGPLVAVIVLFACSVPAWMILMGAELLSHVGLAVQLALVAVELALVAALVHLFRVLMSAPSVRLVLSSGLGACTACGGPVPFEEGATHARCRYCGASSLSTPDMQRRCLQTATARLSGALTDRDRAVLANWDSAQIARVRGMKIPIVPVAVSFSIAAALAITAGFIAAGLSGALDRRGANPTGWIAPVLLSLSAALLYWGVRGVQQTMAENKRFEQVLGRPLKPVMPVRTDGQR